MGRKALDLEKMYQKIMPTYYSGEEYNNEPNIQQEREQAVDDQDNKPTMVSDHVNETLLHNITSKRILDRDNQVVIENITEKLVMMKLDMVLNKMSCCKCDRCKMDIVSMALNALEPKYVVAQQRLIDKKLEIILDDAYSKRVTSEVLKAALAVRKQPRH